MTLHAGYHDHMEICWNCIPNNRPHMDKHMNKAIIPFVDNTILTLAQDNLRSNHKNIHTHKKNLNSSSIQQLEFLFIQRPWLHETNGIILGPNNFKILIREEYFRIKNDPSFLPSDFTYK